MNTYKKFWKKKQTKPNKNGMSVIYYKFVRHFYKTKEEAVASLNSLLRDKLDYYIIFKVDKDGIKFTFLPSDYAGNVHYSYLTGLNIIRAVRATTVHILR